MAKTKRGGKGSEAQDRKKQRLAAEVAAANGRAMEATAQRQLDEVREKLRQRPEVCSHVLNLLQMGAFDNQDEDTEERLPRCCNRFGLLAKPVLIHLLSAAMPQNEEVFRMLPKKMPKQTLVQLLCYCGHISLESALPTKKVADLKTWYLARYKEFGSRLSQKALADPDDFQTWMRSEGYWKLVDDELTFLTGDSVELPEEIAAWELEDVEIEDNMHCWKASLAKGCLKVTCCSIFESESAGAWRKLEKPWFAKEVPATRSSPNEDLVSTPPPKQPVELFSAAKGAAPPEGKGGALE